MDLLQKFLDPNFKPIQYRAASINGNVIAEGEEEEEEEYDDVEEDAHNINYADEYRRVEMAKYDLMGQQSAVPGENSGVVTIGDLRADIRENQMESQLSAYKKYSFDICTRNSDLIIDKYKDEILSLVKTNMVVVVHGPTGCGKSTQVPQYILDDCRKNGQVCNIVVTQPRRIAAISLARRVSEERNWAYGTVCGYQVALERQVCSETFITYVTTGVLLQKIILAKNLSDYTHIIVDEVHERNQDMDFLLLIIRKFLHLNSPNVKVILMSATFDTEKFSHYFRGHYQDQVHRAPTIFIDPDEKKQFTVQEFYADSLTQIGEIPDFEEMVDTPKLHGNLLEILLVLLQAFDRMEKRDEETNEIINIGNVLIFLPGIYEIEEVYEKLTSSSTSQEKGHIKWKIIPLHSSIGLEDQKKAFLPPPPNHRKIILSTNIAESSLTVPDIGYVIDFCLTKSLVMDPETQYQSLKLVWASRANCIQRAGRVGRVRDGRVYRFVTKKFYMQYMSECLPPEILRAPLDRIILASKRLELSEPPKAVLALAIDPPELNNIEYSIKTLKEVGGLLRTCNGVVTKSDGDLTFLGRIMSELPVDVRLAKFIILGYMFNCLQDCIIMAAGCSLANIFTVPFMERLKMYTSKLLWADGSCSDLIAHLHLYKVWSRHKASNVFRNDQAERKWAKQHFVSLRALREWNFLVKELINRLERLEIKEESGPMHSLSSDAYTILKIVMCGAFYPFYFTRSNGSGQVDEREAVKTLSGRDPFRTVYFTSMELGHPVLLYARRIKELLDVPVEDVKISYDGSMRIFVEFLRDIKLDRNILVDRNRNLSEKMPGRVFTQVYRAVKRRLLKLNSTLMVLPKEEGWKLASNLGMKPLDYLTQSTTRDESEHILPTVNIEYVSLIISDVIDAGHFWAQNNNEQTLFILETMERLLNKNANLATLEQVNVGDVVAGFYKEMKMFYRCRIESLVPCENIVMAQVIFIDYGNTATVDQKDLRQLPDEEIFKKPPQAMECVLAGVQPSHVMNPRGLWTEKATQIIARASYSNVYGKVYSVVHGVVHLELYKSGPNGQPNNVSLNQYLIDEGYAQVAEESFLSRENHEKRVKALQSDSLAVYGLDENESIPVFKPDVDPPVIRICRKRIELKGPFSPLEMNIFNCLRDKALRSVTIDPTSVNCVMLDTEPQDPHERLIVAGQINESRNANLLSLRNTTIMPNIHGLSMMMALIFCPLMEPKALADGSRFGQILCGLGTYANNRPIYGEHDICLTLDTELTSEDIDDINEIRYWMNTLLKQMEYRANHMPTSLTFTDMKESLFQRLMKLLSRPRTSVEPKSIKGGEVWRRHDYMGEILQPGEDQNNTDHVWPLHWTMSLKKEVDNKEELQQNLELMTDMATRTIPMNEITCKICKLSFNHVTSMRAHLASPDHKKRVEQKLH